MLATALAQSDLLPFRFLLLWQCIPPGFWTRFLLSAVLLRSKVDVDEQRSPMSHANKIDSSRPPSPRSRRRGTRTCAPWFMVLLRVILVLTGLVAPLRVLAAPTAASAANIDWAAYLGDKGRSL